MTKFVSGRLCYGIETELRRISGNDNVHVTVESPFTHAVVHFPNQEVLNKVLDGTIAAGAHPNVVAEQKAKAKQADSHTWNVTAGDMEGLREALASDE